MRTGHETSHLFTETALYRFVADLYTPKKWFHANVDQLVDLFGEEHAIQKEDLILGACSMTTFQNIALTPRSVIGTLDAPDYALFVSHSHPDGQVCCDVARSDRI